MPRGGSRKGAGRKATRSSLPGGPAFAARVLERINEIKGPDGKAYKSAEDFALELLSATDIRIRKETFLALMYYQYGKPTQMLEPMGFDPNQPLRVLIEHIGAAHKATAKAK